MNTQAGFTFVELVVVLTIVAILAAATIPAYQDFVRNNRITTAANEFLVDVAYARTEAVKRKARVTVCRSTNQDTCDRSNDNRWHRGWIVFIDSQNASGADTPDGIRQAAETLLRASTGFTADLQMIPRPDDDTIDDYISFISRGTTRLVGSSTSQQGRMQLCDDRGNASARVILISPTGRVSVKSPPTSTVMIDACPAPCNGTCP